MKHRTFRRALAWALALVMALSALPFAALAEGTEQPQAGQVTPKTEEPKQEPPAPKAEDNKGEEPKAGEPNRENKDEAPNQEANAETPKPRSEGDAGAQNAETVTFTVQVRVDDKKPTTAWHVWVYRLYSESDIVAEKSGSDGSSYKDMTFTLPRTQSSFAQYSLKVSVEIDGKAIIHEGYAYDNRTALFEIYTKTTYGTTTFYGEKLFRQANCDVLNAQELVDSAMKTHSSPSHYGTGDLTVGLSHFKADEYELYGYVDARNTSGKSSAKNLDLNGAGISLRLTGLSGKLYVFTEDGAPISTDSASGTYYTSTETTLELHNFQEGRYQFRSFENPVTVTFNGSGGTVSQGSVTVESGTTLDLSAFTASQFGYHFDGWKKNDGCSAGNSITPTENTTLYARWDPVTITVYDSGAGSIFSYSPERQGTAIKYHPDSYAEFYWGCSDEQGKIWTEFDFSQDRELTVRYFKLFLNGINELDTDKPWLVTGAPELRDSFPYTGLADLVTQMNITAAEIAPSEALTALARQALQAENVQLQAYDFGVTLTKGGETAPLTEFSRTLLFYVPWSGSADRVTVLRTHGGSTEVLPQGKPGDDTAEGWYIENGRLYFAVRKFSEYAIATAPYTVSFDSNGGSNNPLPMTTGTDGKLANLPSPGTRTGYTFSAWKNGEQAVDENTVYTGDATLTAEWLPITYNVIFDANGGVNANGTGSQSFRDVKYGEPLSPAAVTRASHRFLGWSRSRDGGQIVTELQNLTATQGETVTLYAQWEYQAKSITFDADGGIINSNGSRVPTVTVQTQAEPLDTIDASRFPMPEARRYLTFVGWFTEKNGKGTQVTPSGGITDGTVFTEDTTVYAYWKYEPLTITLDCKGGTVRVNGQDMKKTTMQTRYPGIVDGILPTPTRSGYTFLGWYLSDGTKVDNTTLYEKDTTIYARWQGTGKWNPKTGDQIMLGLSLTILTAAAAGLGAAVVLRKRKK